MDIRLGTNELVELVDETLTRSGQAPPARARITAELRLAIDRERHSLAEEGLRLV